MKNEEFTPLIDRLDKASIALRDAGALLQSIARRYYLVYAYAVQAAEKHDVVFRRGARADDDRRISHQALPDLIIALYAARNSGPVLGGGPGVTRAGRLPDGLAYKYVDQLQKDRKYADYGYIHTAEPYDEAVADERLKRANHVIEDLRSLL